MVEIAEIAGISLRLKTRVGGEGVVESKEFPIVRSPSVCYVYMVFVLTSRNILLQGK